MPINAMVKGKAVIVQPPGQPRFMVVELSIDCDICGEYTYLVAGHHLRPIVELLQEFIDAEPELTTGGDITVVRRKQTTITPEHN